MATAEFSKFAGMLSAALSQHHFSSEAGTDQTGNTEDKRTAILSGRTIHQQSSKQSVNILRSDGGDSLPLGHQGSPQWGETGGQKRTLCDVKTRVRIPLKNFNGNFL